MVDTTALAQATAEIIKEHVSAALAPLIAENKALRDRLDVLEARELIAGEPGKDADPEVVRQMVQDAVAALPPAQDGKSVELGELADPIAMEVARAIAAIELPAPTPAEKVDMEAVGAIIERAVADRVAALPAPQDGKSIELADVAPMIGEEVARAIAAIELPEPAAPEQVDMEAVGAIVERAVAERVAALPAPLDGKSVELADIAPMIGEEVARAVAALPMPKDGVGLAGALIDRTGELVVTLTDGATRNLGVVVGRDADEAAIAKQLAEMVDAIPRPRDGIDAVGFDDLEFEHDGERGFTLRFVRGDQVKEFAFSVPVTIDRGVFRDGQAYAKGDGVTWAGSFWIAQEDTAAKPDSGTGWRLAVKRGRDAKTPV